MDTLVLEAQKPWQLDVAALTERGQKRQTNEDAVFQRKRLRVNGPQGSAWDSPG